MKQQCFLAMIYFSWAIYLGGAVYLLHSSRWAIAIAWLLLAPVAQWAYLRSFPKISRAMGYGSLTDTVPRSVAPAPVLVTLYTALGCPFCPIVEQRLEALRSRMNFSLEKVDITLKPHLIAAKNIRAVPVVEVGDETFAGNATSEQLAAMITRAKKTVLLVAARA
jgi:glutaredoxin